MKCVECGGAMRVASRTHQYAESGLPNVILRGVEVRKCAKCDTQEVGIPNIAGLHACLARLIVGRSSAMTRQEFRFLRQFLGHSSQDFAKLLRVTPETVSRWQTGRLAIPRPVELLVRLLVARSQPRIDYTNEMLAKLRPQPSHPPRLAVRLRHGSWEAARAA